MKIKNWEKFQHYKHRKPPWIKLHHDVLIDFEINKLAPEAFKFLIQLWLIASEDPKLEGNILSPEELSFRLNIPIIRVKSLLSQVASKLTADARPNVTTELELELETEREKEASPAKAEKPKKQILENFEITKPMLEWAEKKGMAQKDAYRETEQFLDYHRARASTFSDWNAAWRTWIRNSLKFQSSKAFDKTPGKAGTAWEEILKLTAQGIKSLPIEMSKNESTQRAVQACGGMQRIGLTDQSKLYFVRKTFIENYEKFDTK